MIENFEDNYHLIPENILEFDELLHKEMKSRDTSSKEFIKRPINTNELEEKVILPITEAKDQGSIGSCTAFAACSCLETLIKLHKGIDFDLSEQFCYSVSKIKDPWRGVWYSGTSTTTAGMVLRDFGVCHENLCMYRKREYVKPKDYMYDDAEKRRCVEIHYLDKEITQIKEAISQKMPVLCAIRMFEGFKNKKLDYDVVDSIGYIKKSGHAVHLYGYDKDYFYIKNSWGKNYGNKGTVLIPINVFMAVVKTVIAIDGLKPFDLTVPEKKEYKITKKPWWKIW